MAVTQRRNTGRSATFADTPFRTITSAEVGTDGAVYLLMTDEYIALDATDGNVTAILPETTLTEKGKHFWLMRIDSETTNTVTITGEGQTINGAASALINLQYSSLFAVSSGTEWLLYASPGSFTLSSDVLWAFAGLISTDQDASIYDLQAKRIMSFVAFDANIRVAPTGSSIIVDWTVNEIVDPTLRVTIAAGEMYGQTVAPLALDVDDTLRPILIQVGSSTPGQTLIMRARGI